MNRITSRLLYPALVGLALTSASGCKINPVTGVKEFNLLSDAQEQAMGDEYDPQVVAQYGQYQDEKLQAFIDEKGQAMARISHRPQLNYEFKILDSPVVNAFAVPGGYVYFTRGIMAHFNNEAEFMGVLGHEIGHITARHSAKQYSKQLATQVLILGGALASPQFAQYSEVAMQGSQLLFLKFSRDNESQSDELGVEYSTAVGYNAHEMANFFRTISRLSGDSGSAVPNFLSTHPNPDNRFDRVHELAAAIQQGKDTDALKVNRDAYLQRIDGLIYGDDPRQGFVENGTFYHPDLRIQFPLPTGWNHQNSPTQFQAAPADGKALLQLSLAGSGTLADLKQSILDKYQLTEVSSQVTSINGLNALEFVAEQAPQEGSNAPIRLLVTLIIHQGQTYKLMGIAQAADFATYAADFRRSMSQFRPLTAADKLNKQPERVRIRTINAATTLAAALRQYSIPASRHNELAILNGMELSDTLAAGTKIKIVQ